MGIFSAGLVYEADQVDQPSRLLLPIPLGLRLDSAVKVVGVEQDKGLRGRSTSTSFTRRRTVYRRYSPCHLACVHGPIVAHGNMDCIPDQGYDDG